MAKSPAWTRKAGQNPKGGLNAKARASYKAQTGGTLKAPVKKSAKTPEQKRRKGSFSSSYGVSRWAFDEGREEDTFEALTRGMGSLW